MRINIGAYGVHLISPYVPLVAWPRDGPLVARCHMSAQIFEWHHSTPDERCHCGIYNFDNTLSVLVYLAELAANPVAQMSMNIYTLAITLNYGKIIIHENGFRSEYSEVRYITNCAGWLGKEQRQEQLLRASIEYNIPILTTQEVITFMEENAIPQEMKTI